jgi:hypothetical protein
VGWVWRIAGLGNEALAWADRARGIVPDAGFSIYEPDPARRRVLDGIGARPVTDPAEWWAPAESSRPAPGAVLIDAELVEAELIATRALAHGMPVAFVGTGGLSPDTLRALTASAANQGLEARVLCGHRSAEDVVWGQGCVSRGELGPLRSARFVRRGWVAAPPGSATPTHPGEGRQVVARAREIWRVFDVAHGLGFCPVDLEVELAKPGGWFVLARCRGGSVLSLDIDDRARSLEPPRWNLEGSLGSYGRGTLRTTNPDGEIVEVPLERPEITGDEPLADFVRCVREGGDCSTRVRQDGERVARAVELADEMLRQGAFR